MTHEMPMALSLIACDTIIEDKQTGKKTLVGLCDRIYSSKFPCLHPMLSVYVSLTSGHGENACEIICRHNDYQTVAFTAQGNISFREPVQVVDLVFRVRNVRFVKAGVYWLQFLVDQMPLVVRPLIVEQLPPKENKKETD